MADYRENVVSGILSLSRENGSNSLQSTDILNVIDHHQLFGIQKSSSLQDTIGHIHRCLNTAANRYEGLLLLDKLVDQCMTEVFTTNVSIWFNLLIQVLESHSGVPEKQLACKILGQLISTSTNFPEISRDLSFNIIPKLMPVLLASIPLLRPAAVECINVCIVNISGPCRTFKSKIDNFLINELDTPRPAHCYTECYALVSRLGVGQSGKQVDGWTERCQSLLTSLHHVIANLYEGLETGHVKSPEFSIFSSESSTEPERSSVLTAQFRTLVVCLQHLLSVKHPSSVKVPGQAIMDIICRCLAVNYKMLLARPTTPRIRLFARLPELHTASLQLLTSLVNSCRTELLPLSDTLNKLFMQCLVYTHMEPTYGNNLPLGTVRAATYTSMLAWLRVIGASCNLATEEKDLVKEFIHDITPVTDTLKLTGTKRSSLDPPPTKKKKNTGYQELSGGISSHRKINHCANSEVTVGALEALQMFVSSNGDILKTKNYQDIVDCVISTVLAVQQNVAEAVAPYQDVPCRSALYRVLQACCLHAHAKVASPLHVCVGLFRTGLQDASIEVSYICREALLVCESLIHPRAPCLRGPQLAPSTITVYTTRVHADQNGNDMDVDSQSKTDSDVSSRNSPYASKYIAPSKFSSSITDSRTDDSLRHKRATESGSSHDVRSQKLAENVIGATESGPEPEKDQLEQHECVKTSEDEEVSDVGMEDEHSENGESRDAMDMSVDKGRQPETTGIDKGKQPEETRATPSTSHQSVLPEDNNTVTQSPEKNAEVEAMLLSFVDAGPDSD